jgi:acyl carrier protein
MNPTDPRERLFEFIQSITPAGSFHPGSDQPGGDQLASDQRESGQLASDQIDLDSLQLLQVVAYLEQNFGVRLEDYNVDPEDLRSAKGLIALIERFPR